MLFAKDELIVRSWEYAKGRLNGREMTSNLLLTNKRLISYSVSPLFISHQEVQLEDVKGIYARRRSTSKLLGALMLVFGVLFMLMSFAFMSMDEDFLGSGIAMLFGGMILTAVGIILVLLPLGEFSLIVTTSGFEGTPLKCSTAASLGVYKSMQLNIIRLRISVKDVDDIIGSLGALIMDNKN